MDVALEQPALLLITMAGYEGNLRDPTTLINTRQPLR